MPDAFDLLGSAVTTDKGSIYDYDASASENFEAQAQRAWDTNPAALLGRGIRIFNEDMASLAGINDRVDQKTAEEEVRGRGLDLKIPAGGITRYELDTLQYLKQREIRQNTVSARTHGVVGAAAGFAGGLAASLTDPINVASNFIPFVSEYRYARWLAQAGTSRLARVAVRVGAGAIEGAAGAAVVEPLVYGGATSQQLDYSLTDSFLNVTLGGVMGGGLHAIGGAVHDARVSRALANFSDGLSVAINLKERAPPDHVQRDMLQTAVEAMERGEDVDVQGYLDAWHGSPHTFDRFDMGKVGTGEGAQAFGRGLYFAENEVVAKGYRDRLAPRTHGVPDDFAAAFGERGLILSPGRKDGLASQKYSTPAQFIADLTRFPDIINDPAVTQALRDAVGGYVSPGSMYQVRINAKPDELLDWDRPLSEQSDHVRQALHDMNPEWTGGQIHESSRLVPGDFMDKQAASDALKARGIKGIRYKDAGSRGAKDGTSNFVVFDDKDVQIVSRNGEPIAKQQSTPRDLGGLIEQAKADRTQAAFNRQFGDEADGRAPPAKPEPNGLIERAKADFDTANDIVDEFRKEGRLTAEDEAALEQIDKAVKMAELKAKATEAAAACMVVA